MKAIGIGVLCASLLLICLSSCATSGNQPVESMSTPPQIQEIEETEEVETVSEGERMSDPFKGVNRGFFTVNDKFYFWLLKPVAQGYKAIIPTQGRVCVRNFISNLTTPVRFLNCLLQLKIEKAGIELSRLIVNSTLGLAGLFDPASSPRCNLEKQNEDTGQTFGVYGLTEIFYIDWPILGPSSVRDTCGSVADSYLNPLLYVNPWLLLGVNVVNMINETSLTLGEEYEELKDSAIDPYVSLRNAYFQHRRDAIEK
jgi:phospholipid-binding lipoprotein MlaA